MGPAPDGGLILPGSYPQIGRGALDEWCNPSYSELTFETMGLFATDIPVDDSRGIVGHTYTEVVLNSREITPVRTLSDGFKIRALSNGPVLALKDAAMRSLDNASGYVLDKEGWRLNILGAASDDTGSAAEYVSRGKKDVNVFILSPEGRVSALQRAQIYDLRDADIHNIVVKGMLDDCQDIVKVIQNDAGFKAAHHIGTVNSINWGYIVAQVVCYFAGCFKATQNNGEKASFYVPSGNFGNICAGHIARQMGSPIGRLIVAANKNDVLDEFFRTGRYLLRSTTQTYTTSSPSIDISKASNFERFVFGLVEHDTGKANALRTEATSGKGFDSSDLLGTMRDKYSFISDKSLHSDRLAIIKQVYEQDGQLVDPHTADGVRVAHELRGTGETMVCLEATLAARFEATIHETVGNMAVPRLAGLGGLGSLPQRVEVVVNDAELVKDIIEKVVSV